jgi:hypothetical protein
MLPAREQRSKLIGMNHNLLILQISGTEPESRNGAWRSSHVITIVITSFTRVELFL